MGRSGTGSAPECLPHDLTLINLMESDILHAARSAYESIGIYRRLLGNLPASLQEVPCLTSADYSLARGILDCITDREKVNGVVPSWNRLGTQFPFTIVEGDAEAEARFERFEQAIFSLTDDTWPEDCVLLTDDARGLVAADLATALGWNGTRVHTLVTQGTLNATSLNFLQSLPAPKVIWVLPRPIDATLLPAGMEQWQMIHPSMDHTPTELSSLLWCDEWGLCGFRRPGEKPWTFSGNDLIWEPMPHLDSWAVTCRKPNLMGWVRYLPGLPLAT